MNKTMLMRRMLVIVASVFVFISMTDPASAGLIKYYSFDSASGDFTVSGATWDSNGGRGGTGAFSFNGSGDYIEIPLNINPGVYTQLTMGAWVKAATGNTIQTVISHDNGSYDRSVVIDSRGGGTGWSAFSGPTYHVVGSVPVEVGEWVFVAVAYDQSAPNVMLFVDGETRSEPGALGNGWSFTWLGRNPSYYECFSGMIDDVFFFDEALSAQQLESIMRASHPVPVPAAFLLLGSGLMGLALIKRCRNEILKNRWRNDMRKPLALLLLTLFLFAAPAMSQANLVTNGSFETPFTSFATLTTTSGPYYFTGWTVTAGSVDVSYETTNNWWQAPDGLVSLDMNGASPATLVSDTFATIPGQSYQVMFSMAGNPAGQYGRTMTMNVSVNNGTPVSFSHYVSEPSYSPRMDLSWEDKSFTFVADSSSSFLAFASTYTFSSYQGPTLDNVRVEAAVPLPAAFLLLGTGFVGLAAVRRRLERYKIGQ